MRWKRLFYSILGLALVIGGGALYVTFYHVIHARDVAGEIVGVERVTEPTALLGGVPTSQVYSFAVAIRDLNGEIFAASTEDRQWAVAKAGMCAEAKYYRYPPWNLDKGNTYFNARLIRLFDCPKK